MKDLTQKQLWQLRGLIQRCGWKVFMGHICGIISEQADKVNWESIQGKALYNFACVLPKCNNIFEEMGNFDYIGHPLTEENDREVIKNIIQE